MPAESVAIAEDLASCTDPPDFLEKQQRVWMRLCPLCQAVLCKACLTEPVRCACGWEWQA
jgi:hypothetical protein